MKKMLLLLAMLVGCSHKNDEQQLQVKQIENQVQPLPSFTLSSSEYVSWSTFMVANKLGLINSEQGKCGELETKHGVDIVLNVVDYDKCIELYGNGASDAVCITNMDILPVSLSRNSTAICPTSTSAGGDQLIVNGINNLDELKNHQIYLLSKSVSEYVVYRVLEKNNKNFREYTITNLDPAIAATSLENNSQYIKAICVWNPFAINVTKKNSKAKVLASSDQIPGEIVDMIVVGNDVLNKTGGDKFARCLCDTFYSINQRLLDTSTHDKTLKMLGEDFSDLPIDDMRVVIEETEFYYTAKDGISLFNSENFKKNLQTVIRVCQDIGTIDKKPRIEFGDNSVALDVPNLVFSTKYMESLEIAVPTKIKLQIDPVNN